MIGLLVFLLLLVVATKKVDLNHGRISLYYEVNASGLGFSVIVR